MEERQTQFIDKLSVTLKSTFPFFPFFALTKQVFFWPHRDATAVVVVAMPIVGVNGSVFGVCVPFNCWAWVTLLSIYLLVDYNVGFNSLKDLTHFWRPEKKRKFWISEFVWLIEP